MRKGKRWEYLIRFLYANASNRGAEEYFRQHWPGSEPSKYAPETMIPELNSLGDQGWEMVHMEPIGAVGKKGDVGFIAVDAMA